MGDPFALVPLGRTSVSVTRLGLGSAALGWLYAPVEDAAAEATVRHAHGLGCRFFDTSPLYGNGLAEARLGRALAGLPRDSFVVSTKVGYNVPPEAPFPHNPQEEPTRPGYDFSYDGALRLVEGSLRRLGIEQIDILLIHDPDDHMEQALQGTYQAVRRMRDEGLIRAIGAGMNESHLLARLAREAEFDCFLLAGRYTLLDQRALADLLPIASEQGIAIYIGGPLNSGILADPYAPQPPFNYAPADEEWITRARRLDAVCGRHGVPLKAAALQFPLGHPAVVAVLTGARSVAEFDDSAAMSRLPLPAALWDDLRSEGLLAEGVPTPA